MHASICITLIIIGGILWGEAASCDSCGRECSSACGTRQFRACCFNYLRKRTSPFEPLSMDPSLRLELWLARSRAGRSAPQLAQTQLEIDENPKYHLDTFKDKVDVMISNYRNNNNNNKDDINDYYSKYQSM